LIRATVTGATGTIGQALARELRERGDEVTALSRNAERAASSLGTRALEWRRPKEEPPPPESLRGQDAVVHLLGETVAQRWTHSAKREIRDSRILATRQLVSALGRLPAAERPAVLVSQSAAGFYGARGDERLSEEAAAGDDFLANVVRDWEAEALKAAQLGLRVVVARTGVVLSPEGGALEKMLPFFKLGIGGPVAGGKQYVPWVHLDDVVGALVACLDGELSGPVNVNAPEPVTNKELSKTLGKVLRRPAFAPVPGLAVKLLYGEMAMIVTTGQRVVPNRLEESGYRFRRPNLEAALRATV
jgi:uncharacterized protein (TIGR01777 family)